MPYTYTAPDRGPPDADLPEWVRPVAEGARARGQIALLRECQNGFDGGCFAEGRYVLLLALRMSRMDARTPFLTRRSSAVLRAQ